MGGRCSRERFNTACPVTSHSSRLTIISQVNVDHMTSHMIPKLTIISPVNVDNMNSHMIPRLTIISPVNVDVTLLLPGNKLHPWERRTNDTCTHARTHTHTPSNSYSRVSMEERPPARDTLKHDDAKTPEVHTAVIRLVHQDLRSL